MFGVAMDKAPHFTSPTKALLAGFVFEEPASAATPDALARNERLGFRCGGLGLMVRYEEGSELAELPAVHRLPNSPAWFSGIVNLHGRLMPVFDLPRLLGTNLSSQIRPFLMILGHDVSAVGILIDDLPRRLQWDAQCVVSHDGLSAEAVQVLGRAVEIDGQVWFELEPAYLRRRLEKLLGADA